MKKISLSILLCLPALLFAQQGTFTLKGNLTTTNVQGKAYLNYFVAGKQVLDSTPVVKGTFTFEGNISEPTKARLILDHTNRGLNKADVNTDLIFFYLEPAVITMSTKDSVKNAVFAGSKVNADYTAFLKTISVPVAEIKALNLQYNNATASEKADVNFKSKIQEKYNKANLSIQDLQTAFIKVNPNSYYSLIVLNEIMQAGMDMNKVELLYESLSEGIRSNPGAAKVAKAIETVHSTSVNAMAPDFTQNDVNDKPVKLSDFRGKYVLLDFWASWCLPCREENPNVVATYNKFKDKGFTVLGVSLDQPGKKDLWLEAIANDGLAWTQVSDLNFWGNEVAKLYGIKGIPQNFLIDPSGKIVATNLRGDALQVKLSELIK